MLMPPTHNFIGKGTTRIRLQRHTRNRPLRQGIIIEKALLLTNLVLLTQLALVVPANDKLFLYRLHGRIPAHRRQVSLVGDLPEIVRRKMGRFQRFRQDRN